MKGFLMSPSNNGKENRSSGIVASKGGPGLGSSNSGNGDDGKPLPMQQVVLAKWTLLKFAVTVGTTMVIGISALLAFYWQHHYRMTSHMEDGTIHLRSGERAVFETKVEAQKNRAKLVHDVKKEVELQHRDIKLKQGEEIKRGINKLTQDLRKEQKTEFTKLLQEVRQTRRIVTGQ